jgi:hypothetical protein
MNDILPVLTSGKVQGNKGRQPRYTCIDTAAQLAGITIAYACLTALPQKGEYKCTHASEKTRILPDPAKGTKHTVHQFKFENADKTKSTNVHIKCVACFMSCSTTTQMAWDGS